MRKDLEWLEGELEAEDERAAIKAEPVLRPPGNLTGGAGDWRDNLARSGSGYSGDERNVLIALRTAPALHRLLRFNEFALKVEFARQPPWRSAADGAPWEEEDDVQLTSWLQQQDIKVRARAAVADCVPVVAREAAYHPVRAYLDSVVWDGTSRLSAWLRTYLGAVAGTEEYLGAVGRSFLVSAVARILSPGCQADHTLVLEGTQGLGKSCAARSLAVCPAWFAADLPDLHGKDARLQLAGRWIIEIAELKAIHASELEAMKSFLTQTHDVFRPPYARRTAQFPRQCVFIGTTNAPEYLRDRTGNRRFWPIKCTRIDVERLMLERDQLWAEAVHLFRQGTLWHLTGPASLLASQEQQERVHVTELEHDVQQYLALQAERGEITVREVLVHALHLQPENPFYAERARKLGPAVAEAMANCGWQKDARRGKERRTTYRRRQEWRDVAGLSR